LKLWPLACEATSSSPARRPSISCSSLSALYITADPEVKLKPGLFPEFGKVVKRGFRPQNKQTDGGSRTSKQRRRKHGPKSKAREVLEVLKGDETTTEPYLNTILIPS
jgi:hypothetical protein